MKRTYAYTSKATWDTCTIWFDVRLLVDITSQIYNQCPYTTVRIVVYVHIHFGVCI